ncbi:hypothetical protein QQS21_012341 [Conoideocrella luteorostrata]|uniref:Major facilitator superfamily (MFS) profile domain-containing protein n=1 Tax=Conoideocrella luteorostrata TaxID=1105319 RepID=A0AAJ0FMG6_9HYPO|nr:hypothetical protein QQS21_012341 [Conoideocrella luteorostrata]
MAFGFLGKLRKKSPLNNVATMDVDKESQRSCSSMKTIASSSTVVQVPSAPKIDIFRGDKVAQDAHDYEKSMSMRYAFRHWLLFLIAASNMAAPLFNESYETSLFPNLFSYECLKEVYGTKSPNGSEYTISALRQASIPIAAACCRLGGLWLAPWAIHCWGSWGYTGSNYLGIALLFTFTGARFVSIAVRDPLAVVIVLQVPMGIAWGLYQGLTLPYISDTTPLKLRGPATAMLNVFWLVGQLVSFSVLWGSKEIEGEDQCVSLLTTPWFFLIPLLFTAAFVFPSPPISVRKGKEHEANCFYEVAIRDPAFCADGARAVIRAVDEYEKQTSESTGILSCFRGTNLRRTEITVVISVMQQLLGAPIIFYSVKLLQIYGLSQKGAIAVYVAITAMGILSTIFSMILMTGVGRRTMWLWGMAAEFACLVSIGTLSLFSADGAGNFKRVVYFISILFAGFYNFTIGPIGHTIVAEIPATRLRVVTTAIARSPCVVISVVLLLLGENLFESKLFGWEFCALAALSWAGLAALGFVWAWFRLPETKDRSNAETAVLFASKVPAWKWRKTVV